jgi:hypothetical protein
VPHFFNASGCAPFGHPREVQDDLNGHKDAHLATLSYGINSMYI